MKHCWEIAAAVRSGQVSAEQVAQDHLAHIKRLDPQIHAFLHVAEDYALRSARRTDQKRAAGEPLGRLAGVPIAVKDNIQVKGLPMTCASRVLEGYVSPFSASVVSWLEEEGATILGKTNLDEFAMGSSCETSAFGPTANPWDVQRVPGGSSGGSAAAVAAQMAPASLGSETGGSVRQPASLCGLVGYKPTYGRLSRYGLVAFGSSLDQIGLFTHGVRDAALLMEVAARRCSKDSTSLHDPIGAIVPGLRDHLEGVRLKVPEGIESTLPPSMVQHFQTWLGQLKAAGASIQSCTLPSLRYAIACYYVIATAEASTNLARFDGIRYGRRSPEADTLEQVYALSREQGFGREVKRRIMLGTFVLSSGHQEAFYRRAQSVRALMLQEMEAALSDADALVLPTSPGPAFHHGEIADPLQMYLQDIFTIPANLCGMPAVHLPAGLVGGLPVGLQLMGPQMADRALLQIAAGVERALAFEAAPTLSC